MSHLNSALAHIYTKSPNAPSYLNLMQHLGSAFAVTSASGCVAGSYLKNTAQLSKTLVYSIIAIEVSFLSTPILLT
jgi:hypothetical protein